MNKKNGMQKYLTIADLQQMFGIGRDKAYRLMFLVPGYKIMNKYYVDPKDLQEYMEKNKIGGLK